MQLDQSIRCLLGKCRPDECVYKRGAVKGYVLERGISGPGCASPLIDIPKWCLAAHDWAEHYFWPRTPCAESVLSAWLWDRGWVWIWPLAIPAGIQGLGTYILRVEFLLVFLKQSWFAKVLVRSKSLCLCPPSCLKNRANLWLSGKWTKSPEGGKLFLLRTGMVPVLFSWVASGLLYLSEVGCVYYGKHLLFCVNLHLPSLECYCCRP